MLRSLAVHAAARVRMGPLLLCASCLRAAVAHVAPGVLDLRDSAALMPVVILQAANQLGTGVTPLLTSLLCHGFDCPRVGDWPLQKVCTGF